MKPYEFAKQPERFSCVVYAWEDLLTEIEQLKAENKKLRIAARLIHQRAQVPSGSKEMADIDAYCKELGLEVWKWRPDK